MSQTSAATVSNIVPVASVHVTRSTVEWIEQLYSQGAVQFDPDGNIVVDEKVRHAIEALHALLAGGEVSIEIANRGTGAFNTLEQLFDNACAEAASANSGMPPRTSPSVSTFRTRRMFILSPSVRTDHAS